MAKTETFSSEIHTKNVVIHIILKRCPHFVDNFIKSSVLLDFTGFIEYNQN